MDVIKVSELWVEVERVAAENPDHVYDTHGGRCKYTKDGKPSCIVGHALHSLGAPIDWLASLDAGNGMAISGAVGTGVLVEDSASALRCLAIAQDQQDGGTPWGEAVALARQKGQEKSQI